MIRVVSAGLLTTVQDEGRRGYQAFGMPVAGAMDRYASRVVNMLAGNSFQEAVLEMTLKGDTLRFDGDCFVAVGGADMQATLDGQEIVNWSVFPVAAGSTLVFSYAKSGCRTYLAVNGGIDVPLVLGSRATYIRAEVGGVEGRPLRAGDVLAVGRQSPGIRRGCILAAKYQPGYGQNITLRVLPGPQDDKFTEEGMATLFNSEYIVTNEADRMGCRLEGPAIAHRGPADIVSDGLCQGAIQVPGNGMPVIMTADCQTSGGYTKIGAVIGPDLTWLAQAKPGDRVTFRQMSVEGAVAALRAERKSYTEIAAWTKNASTAGIMVRKFTASINSQSYQVEMIEE